MSLKRWAVGLMIALGLSLAVSAHAEDLVFDRNFVLQLSGSAVLIGADGAEKVAPGVYASIESISPSGCVPGDELFCALLPGEREYVLIGADGLRMGSEKYQYLREENGYITFMREDLYGVMDRDLKVVIAPEYTQLSPNGEGGYVAITASLLSGQAAGVFYLEPGKPEAPTGVRILYELSEFSEGLMPVTAVENRKVGYLNAKGEWSVAPQFTYAGPMKGGRAVANIESGVGIIDENGNWLLTPNYRSIYRSLNEGTLILGVRGGRSIHLIDPSTYEIAREFSGQSIYCGVFFNDRFAVIYDEESSRLIDGKGDVLMNFDAEAGFDAYAGESDRVIVRTGDVGGAATWLYGQNGSPLFGPVPALWYLGRSDGRDVFAYAKFDVETQTEPSVDWQGTFEVAGTREVGIVGEDGEILLTAKYRDIIKLCDGFFVARTDNAVMVIDVRGREILRYDLS